MKCDITLPDVRNRIEYFVGYRTTKVNQEVKVRSWDDIHEHQNKVKWVTKTLIDYLKSMNVPEKLNDKVTLTFQIMQARPEWKIKSYPFGTPIIVVETMYGSSDFWMQYSPMNSRYEMRVHGGGICQKMATECREDIGKLLKADPTLTVFDNRTVNVPSCMITVPYKFL